MGKLTGGKVLAIVVSFFGVIIVVNLFMAYKAVSTFPGLEVGNSYVASQQFDTKRKAQEALGWTMTAEYNQAAKTLSLRILDENGAPAKAKSLEALIGRTTQASSDQTPVFTQVGDEWVTQIELGDGQWLFRVEALSEDDVEFSQRLNYYVR